ncbi:cytochrome P450 [Loktanella sp. F6476L]|uniref:cytochrome P450 n=1 Tax=Loktanella sp. F6476L TaxID=2926405 RepID=UPI001FF463D6|nr:cytochrome P450 [Loktanella sp. F6476L]MCK0119628.1 cytochrome P450 [Loktanella sp. F6476L]
MKRFDQSPTDPQFVQNPYPTYKQVRNTDEIVWWGTYNMACAMSYDTVRLALRDKRMGREQPAELVQPVPDHMKPFYAIEAHSMLELEPPVHTRLRGQVLRAFTSRRIAALGPEIEALSHHLIDQFPEGPFDLLDAFAKPLPVIIIARLLGVPEEDADQLLVWSNAMVAMYQAGRTRQIEDDASTAALDFTAYLQDVIAAKRKAPADDLISTLIAASDTGEKLNEDELITTCILLLNAGHEATVHTIGNGAKTLLETGHRDITDGCVEEILRFDPPLHMFTRHVYEDVSLGGHDFKRGDQIGCMLAAANRDPLAYPDPDVFDPTRPIKQNTSFGGGIHFCVGAPLARLELKIALAALFDRCPSLAIAAPPQYGNVYHFHGLTALQVTT